MGQDTRFWVEDYDNRIRVHYRNMMTLAREILGAGELTEDLKVRLKRIISDFDKERV